MYEQPFKHNDIEFREFEKVAKKQNSAFSFITAVSVGYGVLTQASGKFYRKAFLLYMRVAFASLSI